MEIFENSSMTFVYKQRKIETWMTFLPCTGLVYFCQLYADIGDGVNEDILVNGGKINARLANTCYV